LMYFALRFCSVSTCCVLLMLLITGRCIDRGDIRPEQAARVERAAL
jgi:hypothetical protein